MLTNRSSLRSNTQYVPFFHFFASDDYTLSIAAKIMRALFCLLRRSHRKKGGAWGKIWWFKQVNK